MSSKTKSITHSDIDCTFLRFVKSEVEFLIDIFVWIHEVNRRRNCLVFYSEYGSDGFNSACCSE